MKESTGADFILEALDAYGVSHIFGNPGTTELPLMNALVENDTIEYVLGLHEDIAVGMAAGYASTRRYHSHADPEIRPVGFVNLHTTPGVAHGLGNLYGASIAGAPLVVTAGHHSLDFQHEEPVLDGDLLKMTEQFTKWAAEVKHVDTLPTMLRRAFRVALTPPTGPVFLGLPLDVMTAEIAANPVPLGPIPDAGLGDPDQVARASDILSETDDIAMVLGDQVARSGEAAIDAAVSLAETTAARVYGEIITAEVNFPTDHPQWFSRIPPNEAEAREQLDADVIVLVGNAANRVSLSFDGNLIPEDSTCIQISNDSWEVGKNEPADVAVVGDPGRVMDQLDDELKTRISDSERERRLKSVHDRREKRMDQLREDVLATTDADEPVPSKDALAKTICEFDAEKRIVSESITSGRYLRELADLGPDDRIANKGGGLGYGLSAALGSAIAERELGSSKAVIGFVGDGSYLYYPQAIYTAVRNDIDVTVVISNNSNYKLLKDNMTSIFGGDVDEYDFVGMDIDPAVDFSGGAASYGAPSVRAESIPEVEQALESALDTDGPTVIDAIVHD